MVPIEGRSATRRSKKYRKNLVAMSIWFFFPVPSRCSADCFAPTGRLVVSVGKNTVSRHSSPAFHGLRSRPAEFQSLSRFFSRLQRSFCSTVRLLEVFQSRGPVGFKSSL